MDLMITKELFTNCIEASKILDVDKEFIARIKNQRDSIQPYLIGSKGQLLEWDKEYREVDPKHRHISHLYALSPGFEISKEGTPELFDAAKKTLEIRGDEATGWSMSWKACCWARLKDGNHAYKIFNNLFVMGGRRAPGLLPNLLSSCPPPACLAQRSNTAIMLAPHPFFSSHLLQTPGFLHRARARRHRRRGCRHRLPCCHRQAHQAPAGLQPRLPLPRRRGASGVPGQAGPPPQALHPPAGQRLTRTRARLPARRPRQLWPPRGGAALQPAPPPRLGRPTA